MPSKRGKNTCNVFAETGEEVPSFLMQQNPKFFEQATMQTQFYTDVLPKSIHELHE